MGYAVRMREIADSTKPGERGVQETTSGQIDASPLSGHSHAGRLIVAEGLDGSGKSTQLQLLRFWLQADGYEVIITEWTPSKLIKKALKMGKKQGGLDPMLLSLLNAADLAELHEREIVPALRRGALVLTDHYVYTALARDLARGVERRWAENLYRFATRPDLSFYFHITADQSLERILNHHPRLKFYQAGLDLGISADPVTSFRGLQQRILAEYESMVRLYQLVRVDGTLPVKQLQQRLRDVVAQILPAD